MVPATTSLQGNERDVIRVQDLSEISNCLQHSNSSSWTVRLNAADIFYLFSPSRGRDEEEEILYFSLPTVLHHYASLCSSIAVQGRMDLHLKHMLLVQGGEELCFLHPPTSTVSCCLPPSLASLPCQCASLWLSAVCNK